MLSALGVSTLKKDTMKYGIQAVTVMLRLGSYKSKHTVGFEK